uniref:AIG1-type G domain-containing protein n=1 Tax=Poecilia reticulata TaxID=8081 RepID=A0A3P9NIY3_POERE
MTKQSLLCAERAEESSLLRLIHPRFWWYQPLCICGLTWTYKVVLWRLYVLETDTRSLRKDLDELLKTFSFIISVHEMRLVLLGNSWYDKSSVANLLLGPDTFNTQEEPNRSIRVHGWIQTTRTVLINTPDLLHPSISESKLQELVEHCVSLSAPGPHVFLLVVQQNMTDQQKQRLYRILDLFSKDSLKHSLVLISTPGWETPGSNYPFHLRPLQDLTKMCGNRWIKLLPDSTELLWNLSQILKINYWSHVDCGRLETSSPLASAQSPEHNVGTKQRRNSKDFIPPACEFMQCIFIFCYSLTNNYSE